MRTRIAIEDDRPLAAPRTRPSCSLDELLAQWDETTGIDDRDP